MKIRLQFVGVLMGVTFTFTMAQKTDNFFQRPTISGWKHRDSSTKSFFPHHVGDTWKVWHSAFGYSSTVITRDSIGEDGSCYIFYNGSDVPETRIDTLDNVFGTPSSPSLAYLRYKLDADSGEVWYNPSTGGMKWAWVARVESSYVFSQPTVVKVFRYGHGHPDSGFANQFLEEHHLAFRFGLIYRYQEPAWVQFLQGCIIDKDTFGVVTSVKLINTKLPNSFLLKQNYPNPFNPSTTVEFMLASNAEVRVVVYNSLGQQVAVLFEGYKHSGDYRIRWDANTFPAGLYFCRLESDKRMQTVKMVLMK